MNPPALSWPGTCGANGMATRSSATQARDDPPGAAHDETAESIEGGHVRWFAIGVAIG